MPPRQRATSQPPASLVATHHVPSTLSGRNAKAWLAGDKPLDPIWRDDASLQAFVEKHGAVQDLSHVLDHYFPNAARDLGLVPYRPDENEWWSQAASRGPPCYGDQDQAKKLPKDCCKGRLPAFGYQPLDDEYSFAPWHCAKADAAGKPVICVGWDPPTLRSISCQYCISTTKGGCTFLGYQLLKGIQRRQAQEAAQDELEPTDSGDPEPETDRETGTDRSSERTDREQSEGEPEMSANEDDRTRNRNKAPLLSARKTPIAKGSHSMPKTPTPAHRKKQIAQGSLANQASSIKKRKTGSSTAPALSDRAKGKRKAVSPPRSEAMDVDPDDMVEQHFDLPRLQPAIELASEIPNVQSEPGPSGTPFNRGESHVIAHAQQQNELRGGNPTKEDFLAIRAQAKSTVDAFLSELPDRPDPSLTRMPSEELDSEIQWLMGPAHQPRSRAAAIAPEPSQDAAIANVRFSEPLIASQNPPAGPIATPASTDRAQREPDRSDSALIATLPRTTHVDPAQFAGLPGAEQFIKWQEDMGDAIAATSTSLFHAYTEMANLRTHLEERMRVAVSQWRSSAQAFERSRAVTLQLGVRLKENERQLSGLDGQIVALRLESQRKDHEISNLQFKAKFHDTEIARANEAKEIAEVRHTALVKERDRANKRADEAEAAKGQVDALLGRARSVIEALQQRMTQAEDGTLLLQETVAKLQNRLEETDAQLLALHSERSEIPVTVQTELASLRARCQHYAEKYESGGDELSLQPMATAQEAGPSTSAVQNV